MQTATQAANHAMAQRDQWEPPIMRAYPTLTLTTSTKSLPAIHPERVLMDAISNIGGGYLFDDICREVLLTLIGEDGIEQARQAFLGNQACADSIQYQVRMLTLVSLRDSGYRKWPLTLLELDYNAESLLFDWDELREIYKNPPPNCVIAKIDQLSPGKKTATHGPVH